MILGAAFLAAQPVPTRAQAWVLALDSRGAVVGDLKTEEFRVEAGGKTRAVVAVKTPAQTADASQSWVLVFEPIRDLNFRATAFLAAADFLTKVPVGDRVFIIARGKDSLESLMPGLSSRRSLWAEALVKVPGMLPEGLVGTSKETLQGMGFDPGYTDQLDGEEGQRKLVELSARFRSGPTGWAGGTPDNRVGGALERLNFDNPMHVRMLIGVVGHEMKALESIVDQFSKIPGQRHMVIFSRSEADDLAHPAVKRAIYKRFKREQGDLGGPAESANLANRDMTLFQASIKAKAVASGVTVYSVAGEGAAWDGNLGGAAQVSGGFAFPLRTGTENNFGPAIQVFGSRYLVQWTRESASTVPASLDISTSRKGVKILAQTLQ
jgi:hypothetical protein